MKIYLVINTVDLRNNIIEGAFSTRDLAETYILDNYLYASLLELEIDKITSIDQIEEVFQCGTYVKEYKHR